ncbi:MAG: hypothetical protein CR971_02420, partial [candidate division SR1 bacterium]
MIKIEEAVKQLGLTKEKFSELYTDKFGKKLSARSKNISDEDYAILEKSVGKKTIEKKNDVLKDTEFMGGGSGFLSGLGFGKIEENNDEKEEIDNESDDTVVSPSEVVIPTVKRSDDNFYSDTKRNYSKNSTRHPSSQRENKGNYSRSGRPQRISGNTEFSQGKYREKTEKKSQPFEKSRDMRNASQKNTYSSPKNNHSYTKSSKKQDTPPPPKRVKKEATTSANLKKKEKITIPESINVKEFSEKMGVALPELMKVMMKNGI